MVNGVTYMALREASPDGFLELSIPDRSHCANREADFPFVSTLGRVGVTGVSVRRVAVDEELLAHSVFHS